MSVSSASNTQKTALARIHNLFADLNETERAIAKCIFDNPDDIVQMSIHALAHKVGVSATSVLRFSQKLGFEGYSDFKLTLARELGRGVSRLPENVNANDSSEEVLHKVFEMNAQALRQTLDLIDTAAFEAALMALDAAAYTELYGSGANAPLAASFQFRLRTIGLRAYVASSDLMRISAAQLDSESVAFVISHKGRTVSTLEAAKHAKRSGATVISLTSVLGSPLGEVADISLVTATTESMLGKEAMASSIARLSVMDALYVSLALRRFDSAMKSLQQTEAIVQSVRL